MPASRDSSHFAALYSGLLSQGNWILVESGRTIEEPTPSGPRLFKRKTPGRITIRKNDGRVLINGHDSPVELSFCALAELLAQNLIKLAGKEGEHRLIYRLNPA